jgi:hypothetical protein
MPSNRRMPTKPPPADTIKKARQAGYHKETLKGGTVFFKEDANLGTRFTSKKCINQDELASILEQRPLDGHGQARFHGRQPAIGRVLQRFGRPGKNALVRRT